MAIPRISLSWLRFEDRDDPHGAGSFCWVSSSEQYSESFQPPRGLSYMAAGEGELADAMWRGLSRAVSHMQSAVQSRLGSLMSKTNIPTQEIYAGKSLRMVLRRRRPPQI